MLAYTFTWLVRFPQENAKEPIGTGHEVQHLENQEKQEKLFE